MLRLGCTLPNLAKNCHHNSTTAKFYPLKESDKDLVEKLCEHIVCGPSIVFTRKDVVDEIFHPDSTNLCKSIVGIDAYQLTFFSMCQAMPTGVFTRWELDSNSGEIKLCQNETRSLENMVMSYFQRVRPQCKVESFYTTGLLKKGDAFSVDGFCGNCNALFEAIGCYYHFCPCQEARPSFTDEEFKEGTKKRELSELPKQYLQAKGNDVIEMYKCDWWNMYKTDKIVKQHLRESFPYKMLLREESFLKKVK